MQPLEPTTVVAAGQLCLVTAYLAPTRAMGSLKKLLRCVVALALVGFRVPQDAVLEAKAGVVDRGLAAMHSWRVVV